MAEDKRKYNFMEPVLTGINKNFISISEEDRLRNNAILQELITLITNKMREKDNLFKLMYSRVFYGGSYYDGLRVGQPDEFDLDLLLSLPKLAEPTLTTSNIPGFVHLQLKGMTALYKQTEMALRYKQYNNKEHNQNFPKTTDQFRKRPKRPRLIDIVKGLDKLIDGDLYLDTAKVLRWMERVVTITLNDFEKWENCAVLKIPQGVFFAKICKGGPAFTLKVKGKAGNKNLDLDIDLVPCFIFGKETWPVNGFRANPVVRDKADFFIVPKPLKGVTGNINRYWRLSFQEQERVIIDRKKTLKPTVKLLKKMRDTLDHKCIASYYLKTVILWQVFEKRDETFWDNSLSYVFMNILKDYYKCLSEGKIPYFWNKKNNLIEKINQVTVGNLSNRIKYIIEEVEKNTDNPHVIAKYLLTPKELATFR